MSLDTWTIEQILSLAHDQTLVGAAESIADASKWTRLGAYGGEFWAEFPNRDKPAYHTLISMPHMALSCNCPSRKYPCRHTLAIALLSVRSPAVFLSSDPPSWVHTFAKERSAGHRETYSAEFNQQLISYQTQLAKAQSGLNAYTMWLHDMVHAGLAGLPKKPPNYWVSMANRLVDHGLFQLAAEVRQLPALTKMPKPQNSRILLQGSQIKRPSTIKEKSDTAHNWPALFLQHIGRHYLIAQGFAHYEQLSAAARADLRYAVGWFANPADGWPETLRDHWLVVGCRQELRADENIHHAWLWGQASQRFALLSQTFPRDDSCFQPFYLGATAAGVMRFHPGAWPFRVEVESLHDFSNAATMIPPTKSLRQASQDYGRALSANPWLDIFPQALGAIDAVREDERWFLLDQEGCRWPLPDNYFYGWHLASLLAQDSTILFGEWNGRFFAPLSFLENERWLPMQILRGIK